MGVQWVSKAEMTNSWSCCHYSSLPCPLEWETPQSTRLLLSELWCVLKLLPIFPAATQTRGSCQVVEIRHHIQSSWRDIRISKGDLKQKPDLKARLACYLLGNANKKSDHDSTKGYHLSNPYYVPDILLDVLLSAVSMVIKSVGFRVRLSEFESYQKRIPKDFKLHFFIGKMGISTVTILLGGYKDTWDTGSKSLDILPGFQSSLAYSWHMISTL